MMKRSLYESRNFWESRSGSLTRAWCSRARRMISRRPAALASALALALVRSAACLSARRAAASGGVTLNHRKLGTFFWLPSAARASHVLSRPAAATCRASCPQSGAYTRAMRDSSALPDSSSSSFRYSRSIDSRAPASPAMKSWMRTSSPLPAATAAAAAALAMAVRFCRGALAPQGLRGPGPARSSKGGACLQREQRALAETVGCPGAGTPAAHRGSAGGRPFSVSAAGAGGAAGVCAVAAAGEGVRTSRARTACTCRFPP